MINNLGNLTMAVRTATAKPRQYKVRETYHSYQLKQNSRDRTPIGEIHLKGNWLIQAGFDIDTPVKVRVMEGCLVVTIE